MLPNQNTTVDTAALMSRIEGALARGEAAALRLDDRQRQLRAAAVAALDILDRLIETEEPQEFELDLKTEVRQNG